MKKWILRLMAVCAVGFVLPVLAQTSTNETPPEQSGNPPMQESDDAPPMPPGDMPPPPEAMPAEPDAAPAQSESSAPVSNMLPTASVHTVPVPTQATSGQSDQIVQTPSAFVPPSETTASNPDSLRLNFNNVPLQMVLNYLSDAAGFIVILDTQVRGNVSVISSHPMTRDEAVNLLNSVLNQNGYAAIRNGRTLTILDKNDAKSRDIPVQVGNNPASIPKNDEIVTQIIPVRYVDASQLVTDLSSFVSPQATIVANQAGNSIVITDTQENIRHLVEIISAIDSSAAGETEIQVFHMNYANPNDVATELGDMFQSSGSGGTGSSGGQLPIRFGGGGGGFGGGGFFARMMAANAGGGGNNNNRAQKQSQVQAVADARTQSVIVMASKDLMPEIAGMMDQLDVPSTRDQKVYVYHMSNGDPQQAMQVLQNMFGGSGSSSRGGSSSSSQQTENSALIQRANQNATTVGQTSSTLSQGLGTGGSGRGVGGGGSAP